MGRAMASLVLRGRPELEADSGAEVEVADEDGRDDVSVDDVDVDEVVPEVEV